MRTDRRGFLAAAGALAGAAALGAQERRKRVAFLGTEVRPYSHAQHFLDRMTLGYAWQGTWAAPRVEVASLYVDQFPDDDLARERAKRHGLTLCPTIEDALTRGTGTLDVDGVVIIAEHGDYPRNEMGQKLYPRYEWFKRCVRVFEASGRAVPVFNDKHLSTTWPRCVEMVEDARRLKIPFLAGSSLPVTKRSPAVDWPHGAPMAESVCVAYGGVDVYDFHALEAAQCMSERRRGGEVGLRRVHALRGEALWKALDGRETTQRLVVAALTRSHTLPADDGYPTDRVDYAWARRTFAEQALGYFVEHRDGLRTTILLLPIRDFNYAGLRSDTGEIVSCQMVLPMPKASATTADFFNPLVRRIEDLVIAGRPAYPVERTLLTSGMTLAGVESLHRGVPVDTPEMAVRYEGSPGSTFWRD